MKNVLALFSSIFALVLSVGAADTVLDEDLVIDGSVYTNLTDNYSGTGGIRVTGGGTNETRRVSFPGYLVKSYTDEGAMVISNAWFLDVKPVSATARGAAMSESPYHWIGNRVDHLKAGERYSTIEFQCLAGTSIKTVPMRLTQVGDNVVVSYGNSLGPYYLACRPVTNEETHVETPANVVAKNLLGVINYREGLPGEVTPSPWQDYAKSSWTESYALADSGAGGYGIKDPVFDVACRQAFACVTGYLPVSAAAAIVLTNAYYLRVEPLAAYVRGGSMGKGYHGEAYKLYHRRDYPSAAGRPNPYSEYQAQTLEGTTVKSVYINIEQRGDDVAVYASDGRHAEKSETVYVGVDFRAIPSSSMVICTQDNTTGYGISNALFACNGGAVRLRGQNTFTGNVVVDNAFLSADGDRTALSTDRDVSVTNGATLVFAATNGGQLTPFKANVRVSTGGRAVLLGNWNAHGAPRVEVDGGVYELLNGNNLCPNFWLKNGAVVEGGTTSDQRKVRVGGWCATGVPYPFVSSEGSGTNFVSASLMLEEYHDSKYLSFDCDADLLMTGLLGNGVTTPSPKDGLYPMSYLYKRGERDLILRGSSTNLAEWRLLEGTLRLEADGQLWASNALYLAGGDLICCANTSNGVSALSVNDEAKKLDRWDVPADAGGTVTFEPGARLTVATKGGAWPAAGINQIVLKGELTNGNFRVGTTKCLTAADLHAFVYEDGDGKSLKVLQDADGYIVPKPKTGLMLIFR